MNTTPITTTTLRAMKRRGERIAAITAYDYTSAQIVDNAGIDVILVGDTLGMVVLGHDTTIPVTLDQMLHHARAVTRATRHALVVGDMPFMTYQVSADKALENCGRMMAEAGVQAVKIEGGEEVAETMDRLVGAGIPVMGHLGYTPQSAHVFGRPRAQGRTKAKAERLIRDAEALQDAGAFAIVLELVPTQLAATISRRLKVPTIGIGSGPGCDGEIQVFHDVFGLYTDFVPRHTKRYLSLAESIADATRSYKEEVRAGVFPAEEHSVSMKDAVLERAVKAVGNDG